MNKKDNLPKIFKDKFLILEGANGVSGSLITIKTGIKTKKLAKESIKSNLKEWFNKFPELKEKSVKIDMAVVIYREPSFIRRQDLDNIAKVVLDALKEGLYYDDSQIVRLLLYKNEAILEEGYLTDSLVISFRKHNDLPMNLIERDII